MCVSKDETGMCQIKSIKPNLVSMLFVSVAIPTTAIRVDFEHHLKLTFFRDSVEGLGRLVNVKKFPGMKVRVEGTASEFNTKDPESRFFKFRSALPQVRKKKRGRGPVFFCFSLIIDPPLLLCS